MSTAVSTGRPRAHSSIDQRRTWRQFFRVMGPGVVSGAADNDPSGVVTYIQVGATTGFGLLWLMLLSTVMLYYLEEMSARLGIVTKEGIGRILRSRYGRGVAVAVVAPVLLSNIITIGADLAGTGAAIQLITGVPWEWWVAPLAMGLGVILVFASYRAISRFLLILTPLFFLYVVSGILAHPPWGAVLRATFIPSMQFTPTYLEAALGLLGATLTPYMFFWQTTEEVEARRTVADLGAERLDVAAGMLYANLVFYFIVLVAGVVLFGRGTGIQDAAEAAATLRPFAGPAASTLFTLGIVISGILAVPVMACSSAYALAEVFGWISGLDKKVWQARGFYVLLIGALGVGAAVSLLHVAPIALMFWSQVLNGLLLPPLFIVLLLLCNDRELMRAHRNRVLSNLVGWGTVLLVIALSVLTVRQLAAQH